MASASLSPHPPSSAVSLPPLDPQPQPQPHPPQLFQRSSSAQPYDTPPLPQNSFVRSSSHPASSPPPRQDENEYLGVRERQENPLPEVDGDEAEIRKVESWSRKLRITDFELMKTLGTGTFARVWLARFANPKNQDTNKVFALKVLKKVDGGFLFLCGCILSDAG